MIKALLSFAVSLIAIFWVACSAFAAGHPAFETNRRTIAGCLCICGIVLCLLGLVGAHRKAAAAEADADADPTPEPESDGEPHAPSSGLSPFSPHYWGVIFGLMGVAVLFIRPLYKTTAVAAVPKPPPPAVHKPPPEPRPVPAARPVPDTVVLPKLKLQGILYQQNNPAAIINGKTYFMGDRVEGVEILVVARNFVSVRFEGATNSLWLRQ